MFEKYKKVFGYSVFFGSSLLSFNLAHASGEIHCKAVDGRSGAISLSVGRLPVLNILGAEITAFGKVWSTQEGAENQIVVGQQFEDDSQMLVDFTDPNVETVLISLRTARVASQEEFAEAGVLRIVNAVYPVLCES